MNVEASENFLQVLFVIITLCQENNILLKSLLVFVKLFLSRNARLYKIVVNEVEEEIPFTKKSLIKEKLLKMLADKGIVQRDVFVKPGTGFPFQGILSSFKSKIKGQQDCCYLISAILENKTLSARFISLKPSQVFKKYTSIKLKKEEKLREKGETV